MTGARQEATGADDSPELLPHLGIELPVLPGPGGAYVDAVLDDGLLYLSGKGPRRADGTRRNGKVGQGITLAEAREDAWLTGRNLLAAIKGAAGSLTRVERVPGLISWARQLPVPGRSLPALDPSSESAKRRL